MLEAATAFGSTSNGTIPHTSIYLASDADHRSEARVLADKRLQCKAALWAKEVFSRIKRRIASRFRVNWAL